MRYDRLFQSLPSGVYAAPALVGPLRAAAKGAGIVWYDFDLKDVAGREDLLRRAAEVFSLPGYFGSNWDALHECLVELASGGTAGVIVHWRRGSELVRRAPEAVATALEILDDAARYWRSTGRIFIVAVDRGSAPARALRPLR